MRPACLWIVILAISATALADPTKWEPTIAKFEERDKAHPPQPGGTVFVGSSTVAGWDTEKWFPDMGVINRGFGGSKLSDAVYYFDRVVKKYEPRVVVVYSGDNDLAAGSTPEQLVAEYEKFAVSMREQLPNARLIYIGIRPSLARLNLLDKQRLANDAIRRLAEKDEMAEFIDVFPALLGPDGKPREDLLVQDKLHLNDKGYEVLTGLVMPVFKEAIRE